jgi:glycosyltransferase involved in cell wall biosynthesis
MEAPLVSVVIPTYNRPDLLERAVRSVQAQTLPNVEIIVVNDCGVPVDELLQKLDNGRHQVLSIRAAHNLGRGGVRNLGLKLASGKYVAYLDDDDYYYPQHLDVLYRFILEKSAKVVYTDSLNAIQEMRGSQWITVRTNLMYSSDFDMSKMLVENYIPTLCILHERSCLEKTGLFDESLRSHEDWDMWIRLMYHFTPVHLAQVTSEYTTRINNQQGQSTTDVNADFYETQRYIYGKYAEWVKDKPEIKRQQESASSKLLVSYEYLRSHLVVDFIQNIMGFVDKGDYAKALGYYEDNTHCHKIKGFEKELEQIHSLMEKVKNISRRK